MGVGGEEGEKGVQTVLSWLWRDVGGGRCRNERPEGAKGQSQQSTRGLRRGRLQWTQRVEGGDPKLNLGQQEAPLVFWDRKDRGKGRAAGGSGIATLIVH